MNGQWRGDSVNHYFVSAAQGNTYFSQFPAYIKRGRAKQSIQAISESQDIIDTRMNRNFHPSARGFAMMVIVIDFTFMFTFMMLFTVVLHFYFDFLYVEKNIVKYQRRIIRQENIHGRFAGSLA